MPGGRALPSLAPSTAQTGLAGDSPTPLQELGISYRDDGAQCRGMSSVQMLDCESRRRHQGLQALSHTQRWERWCTSRHCEPMHVAAEKILSWATSSLGEHSELGILLHGCCLRDLHWAGFVCRRAPLLFYEVTPTRKNPLGVVWVGRRTFAAAFKEQISTAARDLNHSVFCPAQRARALPLSTRQVVSPSLQCWRMVRCAAPAEGLLSVSIFPSRTLQGLAVVQSRTDVEMKSQVDVSPYQSPLVR